MKKRKDGRYQSSVMITDPLTNEKKRVYVYGYTEDEIIREKERVKRNNGANSVLENIPFNTWVNKWLRIKKDEIALSTYDSYKLVIDTHILPKLKDISLKKITPATVRQVLREADGDRTKKYVYVLLNAIMQQAYKDDIIRKNPCIAVKPPKYKPKEKVIITLDEFNTLLKICEPALKNLFTVAYYTGMRRAEISALKWKNVDFDNNIIKVVSAVKVTAQDKILDKPKSDSGIRSILMPKVVITALKAQQNIQKARYFRYGDKITSEDFVFTSQKFYCKMLSPAIITKVFNRTRHMAKLNPAITFHSFRHAHATYLVEAGLPIKAIQARMGHASASFTMSQYVHNTVKMQKQIVGFLDKMANQN